MMAAFSNLATSDGKPDTGEMAGNIMLALITTACGLAIAVPLVLCTADINIRIRKMEDLVASGITHLMDSLGTALGREGAPAPAARAEPETVMVEDR